MFRSCERQKMVSASTLDSLAQGWAKRLEVAASRRTGLPISARKGEPSAREVVARELGAPVTTSMVRNVSEGRIKAVNAWLLERLRKCVEKQLSKEIRALENELEITRRRSPGLYEHEVVAVENHLAAAREKLAALSPGARR